MNNQPSENSKKHSDIEKPPIFKKWSGWYLLLLGTLATLVGLFYWFTKAFS